MFGYQYDPYQMSLGYTQPVVTHFSIDVECVATGTDHNSRSVAQIALVDQFERVLLNVYVKPEQPVVSYLTPLTGLTQDLIEQQGVPFQQGIHYLKSFLPASAVLIGQNIGQDVRWLQLKEGRDFQALLDLAGIYRAWNTKYNTWSIFGQDHVARVLMNYPVASNHDAVGDAIKSVRLYNLSQQLQQDPEAWQQAQQKLLAIPPEPSFAKQNPSYEGVCMGNRKTCTCGAPFLG
ncbi:hypothetical protein WJX82_005037 [Trebouxia sp. C0006]